VRQRAFIHVGGPRGAGKTTFVEAVLEDKGGLILAARCVCDDSLKRSRETTPKTGPELRRYRDAGASGVAIFTFPRSDGHDAFFETDLMSDYSEAVVIEGDSPLEFADLHVFIAPPLPDGKTLLVRRRRDLAREGRDKVDALERLLRQRDGAAELLGQMVGSPLASFARRSPWLLEKMRRDLLAGIATGRHAPPPRPTQHWGLAAGYEGIEHAQLVVINVRGDRERERGEGLAAEIGRLRKDEAVFNDILGYLGSKTPVTIVVANLLDAKGAGRKKALVRVRRALRAGAPEKNEGAD
jgi:hypothetical protein